jgi:hypothetical protein
MITRILWQRSCPNVAVVLPQNDHPDFVAAILRKSADSPATKFVVEDRRGQAGRVRVGARRRPSLNDRPS